MDEKGNQNLRERNYLDNLWWPDPSQESATAALCDGEKVIWSASSGLLAGDREQHSGGCRYRSSPRGPRGGAPPPNLQAGRAKPGDAPHRGAAHRAEQEEEGGARAALVDAGTRKEPALGP